MNLFSVKNLSVGPKSSISDRKATRFQIFGRFMHPVFFIFKNTDIVIPTTVKLTNEQKKKNNAYASTDPLSKNKNIDNFLLPNQCHQFKSITQPTPLLSLPYRKSLGVFVDMCFYIGPHVNSDIYFFFSANSSRPVLFSAVSAISRFVSDFFPHDLSVPPFT